MTLTAWGLLADLFGVLLVGLSSRGWYVAEGYQTPGSWISHGPIGRWWAQSERSPQRLEEKVNFWGWVAIVLGFALQLGAEVV